MARALSNDARIKVDHSVTLPDISSPRNQGAASELMSNIGLGGRNAKRNSTVVAPSKMNMDIKINAKTVSSTPTNGTEMKNLFESRRSTEAHTINASSKEETMIAKSLNNELRNQYIKNRKRMSVSNAMQPPHLTVSV